MHSRFVRVQNEGTGKSSWWMLNPEAMPASGHTRRSSGSGSSGRSGSPSSIANQICGATNSGSSNVNGIKNSRRRAQTLDCNLSRAIDKRARGANVKGGGRRRRDSGGAISRISSNG